MKKITLLVIIIISFLFFSYVINSLGEQPEQKYLKKVIDISNFVKSITGVPGIELEKARYFSDNFVIHPLVEISLSDPLYNLLWFSKTFDSFSENIKSRKFSPIFYAIAKYSGKIKRIDIIQDPSIQFFEEKSAPPPQAMKVFSGKIESPSLIFSLVRCISKPYSRYKSYAEKLTNYIGEIKKFEDQQNISSFLMKKDLEEINNIIEVSNTSFYNILLCFENFLSKIKDDPKMLGVFNADISDFSVLSLGEKDSVVVIPQTPTIIIDAFKKDTTYIYKRWNNDGLFYPSLAIIIDFGGNDRYVFENSSVLSLVLTYDGEGNDQRICNFTCFGGSIGGADMLIDISGNDTYKSLGISQGAGILGTGVLLDYDGDDTYESVSFSQGFGGFGGGALIDFKGNDKYILKEGTENPSFQDRTKNLSMGQGCGSGLRADFLEDFKSVPGGLGLLFDYEGNDSYSAQVFSQGCGYWYGIGVLLDGSGNDTYKGYWYCQGTSAHFGTGVLSDFSGDDSYFCHYQGMGQGHDLGIGILLDVESTKDSDSDSFECKSRCLGMGHANGIGVFINQGGSDFYRADEYAFGDVTVDIYKRPPGIREIIPTWGFFFDLNSYRFDFSRYENTAEKSQEKLQNQKSISKDKFLIREKEISPEEIKSAIKKSFPFLRTFFYSE